MEADIPIKQRQRDQLEAQLIKATENWSHQCQSLKIKESARDDAQRQVDVCESNVAAARREKDEASANLAAARRKFENEKRDLAFVREWA